MVVSLWKKSLCRSLFLKANNSFSYGILRVKDGSDTPQVTARYEAGAEEYKRTA